MKLFSAGALLLLSIFALQAVPLRKTSPVIDGDLSDNVWKSLPWKSNFTLLLKRTPAPVQTRFKSYNDGKYLYFAVECDEPQMAKVKREPYRNNAGRQYANDSVEINLVPDAKLMKFYKVVVDVNGSYSDFLGQDDNTDRNNYIFNGLWRSNAKVAVKRYAKKYTVEAAIPFGSMDYLPVNNDQWRINVGRNRWVVRSGELSSYSPIATYGHAVPSAFRKCTVQGFKSSDHLFDMDALKGEILQKNGKQHYKLTATIHNNTASYRIFRMNCAMTNVKTGKVYKGTGLINIYRRTFANHSITVKDVPNGEYIVTWDLCSNRTKPVLEKRLVSQVKLEYVPLKITLKRPAYRNNIYHTMKDKTIEAVISLQGELGRQIKVSLTGKGVNQVRTIARAKASNTLLFNGAKLPKGDYILTAETSQNGKKLATKLKIRVLPYKKGEVYLDSRGVPHIDGKEFFSHGWYSVYGPRHPYYNTNINIARFRNLAGAERAVKTAFEKFGLRSMVVPFQDMGGYTDWRTVIFKDPDTRKKGLTPLQKQKIIEFVNTIKKQEGLIGYYMADEPECRDGNPAWYEEAYALIRELDPYHPCFMLNWGLDGVRKYYKSCDILIPDCYPQYFADDSTSKPRWAPSDYAKVTTTLRPSWQMPQATCWPDLARDGKLKGIAPTVCDLRSQVFQPIAHNVKGINYYSWCSSQRYTPAIVAPPAIGKVLHEAAPYLLENSLPGGAAVTTVPHDSRFQTGLKVHKGKLCLIAINTSMKKLAVTFRMKVPFTGLIYPEGAKRAIRVNKGVFKDTFNPNETILYFTDKALASKLICGRDLVKQAEKMRQDRKKKGNLVAMGDMHGIDYIRFGKKQYYPNMPIITASSDRKFYITQKTGSLYYLVDGLTKPNRVEYSWSPSRNDKKRFLQFKLPKKSSLKKVVLYTPHGNLTGGFVTVNGKKYPFDNKKRSTVITIPLPGKIVSDTVRITCSTFKYVKSNDSLGARLLTEVEIY